MSSNAITRVGSAGNEMKPLLTTQYFQLFPNLVCRPLPSLFLRNQAVICVLLLPIKGGELLHTVEMSPVRFLHIPLFVSSSLCVSVVSHNSRCVPSRRERKWQCPHCAKSLFLVRVSLLVILFRGHRIEDRYVGASRSWTWRHYYCNQRPLIT